MSDNTKVQLLKRDSMLFCLGLETRRLSIFEKIEKSFSFSIVLSAIAKRVAEMKDLLHLSFDEDKAKSIHDFLKPAVSVVRPQSRSQSVFIAVLFLLLYKAS